jgi:DNA-binding CsgD family transcriptional regulator
MGSLPRGHDGEWLDFVADLLTQPLTSWPDERVLRLLVTTFDAGGCVYHDLGAGNDVQKPWPPEHFAPYLEEQLHWFHHHAADRHPLLRYHLVTGRDDCMQCDDVPSGLADRRMQADWRARGRRWGGVQAQLSLPIRFGPPTLRSFVVGRSDRYTREEMQTARCLVRLLRGVDGHVGTYARWAAAAPPDAAGAADAAGLTPREIDVLELLTSGRTAGAIGRRLMIAERTVQKHLQRVYTKLGVADRLGAVRRAEFLGLVQPPVRTQFPTLPPG